MLYDGSDSYRSTLDWNYLHLGNNGGNHIVAGRTNTGGYLRFFVNNTTDVPSGINGTEAMRISSAGNVGIGTPNPSEVLHVSGNITSSGHIESQAGFFINDSIISSSYTIPAGKNAMTIGPIEIADGVTVEIPSDGSWSIV